MKRTLLLLLLLCLCPLSAALADTPTVALFYGPNAPLDELKAFDIVVVDPDHGDDPVRYRKSYSELYAYVGVGEAHPSRTWFKDIPGTARLADNRDWGSLILDLSQPVWSEFLLDRVFAPLWQKGYRGFFLDTLDSYRLARQFDEDAQQAGLVALIERLHQRFPGIQLILNRGFDIVPQVKDKIRMVAAESLFQGWDASRKRYVAVKAEDREWLLGELRKIRDLHGIPVLAIDYVSPQNRVRMRETAAQIQALGVIPWVTDATLSTLGLGGREVVPRRIAVLYDAREAPALNYTTAHRFLEMPINHLGYIAEYLDVGQALPPDILPDKYAGIVFWLTGAAPRAKAVNEWIVRQAATGVPIAFFDRLPFDSDAATLKALGLARQAGTGTDLPRITQADPMFRGEAPLRPNRNDGLPLRLSGAGTPLLTLAGEGGQTHVAAALMPWGGFALSPFVTSDIPGTEQSRWHLDPFAFLTAALRLPVIPVPDITTENGRRLLTAHIDGDGFPTRAELPGSPLASRVLLEDILQRYRIPHAMSVIEAEVAPHGLYPELSAEMEDIARRMFALPHVEIASHTFSHPFRWDNTVKHGIFKDADADESYHLAVPGYHLDLTREIVGSMNYVQTRLAPPDKTASLLLWSGDTAPGAEALGIVAAAGFLNMNGGDTQITRSNPSLTAVAPIGIRKGRYQQIYAPMTNENIYTNLWRGPFYGFRRVIETFELTEMPRRLKPIGIYYHTYVASKRASLESLHEVYRWALGQKTLAVYPTDYVRKALDFGTLAIAREGDSWRIRGEGHLRTVRAATTLGTPDPSASSGVAGYAGGSEGNYVHLAGNDVVLRFSPQPSATPYLHDSNARLDALSRRDGNLRFALRGYVPIEFRLNATVGCRVLANGKPLTPLRGDGKSQLFVLKDAAATIETRCHDR